MRKIKTTDVFNALRLVQKSGLKEQLVPVIEKLAKNPDSLERSGIYGFLTIVEVFSEASCEALIYEWLSGPCECKPKEIANWELDELAMHLTELAEGNDLRNFFTALSSLISRKH